MSLYRIEEIRYEEGFTLKDLFLGETVEVKERIGTRQLVRWDLIATRILEMDGALRLTGGIIPFPLKDKDAVLETLGVEYVRFRAVHSGASKEEFLKEEGGVLYRLARQRLDAPLPSLLTSDGDSVAFCRARYHIEEPAGLPEKIGSIPGMEAEEGPKVFFRWVEPVGEEKGSVPEAGGPSAGSGESLVFTSMFGSGRSLGSIEVSGDRLVLECMSEARLARGRALLEEHLAGTIIHRGDTVQDPWQAIAERKEEGSVRERRPSDSIPPEVEKQLYLDFMDQHYQDWLDEPLPALSGMNPREAVAAKGGRSRVAELIRQIEHGQAVQHREKGFAFDTSWLWEELGLDPAQD